MGLPSHTSSRLPKSIALIGAGGFLGANLARHLAPLVPDLRCFGRRPSFPDIFQAIHWISGDTSNPDDTAIDEALAGCDTVIHLASTSTPSTADQDIVLDAQANVIGSLRLFERCIAAGVKRVVFISSGGTVYGIPQVTPTPESAPTLPITAYGVAKLAIEKYLEIYRRQRSLDYRVLRVANAYGPFQTVVKRQGVVAAFLSEALRGDPLEIWGDGRVIRDYVYVQDVVEAVIATIEYQGEERVFNIGSGIGHSLAEVVAEIEGTLGISLEKRFRTSRPVDVPVNILDCGLARRELGWQAQISFADGMRLSADWMKSRVSCEPKQHDEPARTT